MDTDPIDQVARDQVRTKLNAIQHAVTEAKQLLDKEQGYDCIVRLSAIKRLVEFDTDYVILLKAIEDRTNGND